MTPSFCLVVGVYAGAWAASVVAETFVVDPLGTEGWSSVQSAIAAARDGDTIRVRPGTYEERLDFLGKAIEVASDSGPEVTIIDGGGQGTVVVFQTGEGPSSVLGGFTVRGGDGNDAGGILISRASPTIVGNIITENRAFTGLGVTVLFGSPTIRGNRITRNNEPRGAGGVGGGGILLQGAGAAYVVDNEISWNRAVKGGGIALFAAGEPVIERNVIRLNIADSDGGGLSLTNRSEALIVGNVIVENSARRGGGIYWLVPTTGRGPLVVNNTIVDNVAGGAAIYASGSQANVEIVNNVLGAGLGNGAVFCDHRPTESPPMFRSNDIYSLEGIDPVEGLCGEVIGVQGNFSADPLLAPDLDYRPLPGSPVVDAGESWPDLPADMEGQPRPCGAAVDLGAHEVCSPVPFQRGDANGDGLQDIADPVAILLYGFGTRELGCLDAADVDDDGSIAVTDAVVTLEYQFSGGAPPPSPFPACGLDETEDSLGCLASPCQ